MKYKSLGIIPSSHHHSSYSPQKTMAKESPLVHPNTLVLLNSLLVIGVVWASSNTALTLDPQDECEPKMALQAVASGADQFVLAQSHVWYHAGNDCPLLSNFSQHGRKFIGVQMTQRDAEAKNLVACVHCL